MMVFDYVKNIMTTVVSFNNPLQAQPDFVVFNTE